MSGVRARMVGLVLVSILPLVAIYLVQTNDLRDQAETEANADSLRLSRLAAEIVAADLDETRSVLTTATSGLVAPSASSCGVSLAAIQQLLVAATDALVINASGVVVCSAVPASTGLDLSDRSAVITAAELGEFVAEPEWGGDLTAQPALLEVLPVEGRAPVAQVATIGDPSRAIAAFVAEVGLPAESTVSLVDVDGRLVSSTDADEPLGEEVPMTDLVDQLGAGAAEGTVTEPGPDDIERIYGYADITGTNQTVYAVVGLPTEAAFATLERELRIDLLSLILVGAVAVFLALLLSEASVARPVGHVVGTVRMIGDGDLDARTGDRAGRGEIGELARAIDDMADDLVVRERSLREAGEERERLLGELLTAEEEERRRIAADIHDDTIQMLIAAGLEVGILRRDLASGDADPGIRTQAESVERVVYQAVGRLRHLMFELEPPRSEDGLGLGIKRYVGAVLSSTPAEIAVDVGDANEPTGVAREVLYRNIREAAINATRHGDARLVTVTVRSEGDGIGVTVADDGRGFDADQPPPDGHHGLRTMQRRTEAAGGRFVIESDRGGGGTVVSFWLPS